MAQNRSNKMTQYIPIVLTVLGILVLVLREVDRLKIIPERFHWIVAASLVGTAYLTESLATATTDQEVIQRVVLAALAVWGFAQNGRA